MPDSRALPSLRSGTYDDPPASSEASTPRTRRQRVQRDILRTLHREVDSVMASPERQARRSTVGGLTRRRQRSSSEHDELSTSTPDGEDGRRRRSTKRRRLNAGVDAPTKKAIKYGYYGQVEPGRLNLELVSCDGGQHVDARHPETSLGPENLLRHDRSVYCSERPQTNVILKHADDTPFCLEKLHIVGPEMGFTAPVRAGVVYVGMTMADLQKYVDPAEPPPHARRSRYSPYRRQERRRMMQVESGRSSPELLSVAEALRDPYINAAHSYNRDHDPAEDSGPEAGDDADIDAYCDSNPATDPTNWLHDTQTDTFIRRTQPVTILSDEDAGPEESSPQEVLDYRSQRERMMRRRYDIESWHRREAGMGPGTGGASDERESFPGPRARMEANGGPARMPRANGDFHSSMANLAGRGPHMPGRRRVTVATWREREAQRREAGEREDDENPGALSLSRLLSRRYNQSPNPARPSSPGAASTSDSDNESLPPLEAITPPRQLPAQPVDAGPYHTMTDCPISDPYANSTSSTNVDKEDTHVTTTSFRLSPGKFKVAIEFSPPVSGRFILLNLWADSTGREDLDLYDGHGVRGFRENVDVQSIVAKGWMGGMRFFPAVERR